MAGGILHARWPVSFLPVGSPVSIVPALILLGSAVLLGTSALAAMSRARTPHHPAATPTALVVSGPFRWTRNPLYLALLLVLTSFAFLLGSVWVLLTVPVLVTLLTTLAIRREERALEAVFGEEYAAYRRRVRRWL